MQNLIAADRNKACDLLIARLIVSAVYTDTYASLTRDAIDNLLSDLNELFMSGGLFESDTLTSRFEKFKSRLAKK